ncbi:hypothetical protein GCM10025886_14160 [Tetragenococcus halophilus subsp. flandriensis]|uniref:TcpE family conjugal transfer membrane protein n=1 Tax=Tetragenococcus halophilus TaxID=51669 RepID=UPI0023E9B6DE|nr:TcpE family conjugal transfer membrane protein [Tetragenococcus halophilus]GMA08265.1 hypothetical protein GCM10025886_14160 [Tetragenococcus halophilus subsp. flandriensis]
MEDHKRTVNYTGVMNAPSTFKISFWKINLPWIFRLETAVIYVVSFLFLWVFLRVPINWLDSLVAGLGKVVLFGLPYLITIFLIGRSTDGKSLWNYLKDFVVFYVMEKVPKNKYCHEEKVDWLDESIEFIGMEVEENRGSVNEVNVTTENDT